MEVRDCPECSAENAADAVRCSNCGWPLNRRRRGKGGSDDEARKSYDGVRIIFGLIFLAFVIALLKSWAE
ncbi:MAG: zinc ribbon domain-containing protein [Pseudomonadota bacterium]